MYRDAVVRCQKARDWVAARTWADRGLAAYGTDAARPEAVADLHKRREYANAKIETNMKPRTRGPARAVVTAASPQIDGQVETLICAQCGAVFQRASSRSQTTCLSGLSGRSVGRRGQTRRHQLRPRDATADPG